MIVNRPNHSTQTTLTERVLFAACKIVPPDMNKIAFRKVWKGPSRPRIKNTLAISLEMILHDRMKLGNLQPERRDVHCALLLNIADGDSIGLAQWVDG